MSGRPSVDPLLDSRRFTDAGGPEPMLHAARPSTPESRLLLAVLEDAVRSWRRCARQQGGPAARLRGELRDWFLSDTGDWPFAFATLCEHLDLNPVRIRLQLGLCGATPLAA